MKIEIWGRERCRFCTLAKQLCDTLQLAYEYIEIDTPERAAAFQEKTGGASTVPQVFVDGEHIGGYVQFQTWTLFNLRSNAS